MAGWFRPFSYQVFISARSSRSQSRLNCCYSFLKTDLFPLFDKRNNSSVTLSASCLRISSWASSEMEHHKLQSRSTQAGDCATRASSAEMNFWSPDRTPANMRFVKRIKSPNLNPDLNPNLNPDLNPGKWAWMEGELGRWGGKPLIKTLTKDEIHGRDVSPCVDDSGYRAEFTE